ncbi:SCO family protein [Neopusillimonas maritima]|uniref:SCO family protein n=1 Tax=Neopusillimonas maritima TaxID=2026239 RepID=A0ABX9MWE5_9BURK|nr:SCO family protein [Neopusillimonas maritima]RII83285.1 SCO family protein [Neopusillimonas maritima]
MFLQPSKRRFLKACAAGSVALALAGCGEQNTTPSFHGSDISGSGLGADLNMTDHTGQTRTLADFNGKALLVFFGFTHCPDVCPTAMAQLAQTMQVLGEEAQNVQVAMISVDPERDTPERLAQYVKAFHPDFIGLTGTPEQLKQTAGSFRAFYGKVEQGDGDYSMDHSASFYLFDKEGNARVLIRPDAGPQQIADDVMVLL